MSYHFRFISDFTYCVLVPDAVEDLRVSDIMANNANALWLEPCFKNDINVNYSITIEQLRSDGDTYLKNTTFRTTNVSTELLDLLPFRNYTVSVTPVNTITKGPYQHTHFRTKISGTTQNATLMINSDLK